MNLPTYIAGALQTRAYAVLRKHVYAVLTTHDITPSHWSMLGIIIEARDGIRQSEVAKALNVKPPLVTVMVRYLEERGLIQTVPNQFDARAKLLSVTPEGKKLIKQTDSELNKQLDRLLTGLTEKDLIAYHKVLSTIVANDKTIKSTGINDKSAGKK
jgi:DNA-binding MarR family transcriptional regulator